MTKQFLQLSALTLAGSPTTSLRTQYSSALEPRNLFLLVADIYRRISFLPTKISFINHPTKLVATELRTDSKPTANKGFAIAGFPCFADTFVQGGSSVLRMEFSDKTPRHRKPPERCASL